MNTAKLKTYAPQARKDFIKAVTERANYYGIFSDDHIEPIEFKGDVAIVGERAFAKKEGELREKLVNRIKRDGFELVMRACAYTLFNRFVALRYMELHDYLEHGYRVLSNNGGSDIPEILEHATDVDYQGLDKDKVVELRLAGNKDNELYRLLIVAQCNALHKAMPFLFEKIDNETELLLPDNLLHSNSPIRKLVTEIDEEDWNDVEIIGWIYQFYISERKDEVIGKVVQSEDIPAATQLFTPNWIVKYMVQNTLGRMWLATYPDSSLKEKMEYYIEPAEQEHEVQEQLDAITPKELNPEEITFLDPACGSGHILVEAYDILKEIYLERGYRTKDIPRLILEKNLYGLEIDGRAAQLACLAVLMRARKDDRKILNENNFKFNIIAIKDTEKIDAKIIAKTLLNEQVIYFSKEEKLISDIKGQMQIKTTYRPEISQEDVINLVDLYKEGKSIGSLIKVTEGIKDKLPLFDRLVKDKTEHGDMFEKEASIQLSALLSQTNFLTKRYHCVVTNPPYMGNGFYNAKLKKYLYNKYPRSKADLYGCFISKNMEFCENNFYIGMITIPNWMYLSSFEDLRYEILKYTSIQSLINNGRGIWGSDFGSCSFTIRKAFCKEFNGIYRQLFKKKGSVTSLSELEKKFFNNRNYVVTNSAFLKIPGAPIAYQASKKIREIFAFNKKLSDKYPPKAGISSGANERFILLWHEVNINNIGFNQDCKSNKYRFYPHNKGGGFAKWYGNHYYIIKYSDLDIQEMEKNPGFRHDNKDYYFKPSVSWGKVTISKLSARYYPDGFAFDSAGISIFPETPFSYVGFLNSIVCEKLIGTISQSLNFTVGAISKIPILENENISNSTVKELIENSKENWDSYEISWNFRQSPLLSKNIKAETIENSFNNWLIYSTHKIQLLLDLETKNNMAFIEAFGLQSEITFKATEENITLMSAEREIDIKNFISYSIGCMMGRYSLEQPGLIYAYIGNKGFDSSKYKTFPADEDGIIPIMDQEWFPDDATNRFAEFLKVAWSSETLDENLKFVADSLKLKNNEAPVDAIRRYLSTSFFKDHLKTYKKRPIYWLFSSGKQKAFECLVYLHRYNETTLSRMRSSYVTPLQGNISARLEFLQNEKDAAGTASAQRKFQKEIDVLRKKQTELSAFDDELRHYADMKISLDLDDGVKVNYGKFGNLLAEKKAVTGKK